MKRNRWENGDWLVIDEESGLTRYASEVRRDGYGSLVTSRHADDRHPVEFSRSFKGEVAVPFSNYPAGDLVLTHGMPRYMGNTTIPFVNTGAAAHLHRGIGYMKIGTNFVVR